MNSTQLVGRLTAEPELHNTPAGKAVCRMRLAVPRPVDDAEPVYIDIVAWGALAENCAQYLTKGRQVAVSGRLDYSEWADAQGNRHSRHEVVAAQVDFLAQPRSNGPEGE
jgi:single-strand DNA-binding protein